MKYSLGFSKFLIRCTQFWVMKKGVLWMLWENLVYVDSISLWITVYEKKNKYRCPVWKKKKKGTVTRHDRDIASFQMSRSIWYRNISSNIHWKSANVILQLKQIWIIYRKSSHLKILAKGNNFSKISFLKEEILCSGYQHRVLNLHPGRRWYFYQVSLD